MGMASPEADAGVADRARSAIQIVGLVIAPTTLVTALMFYFGWVQTNARSSYFGIDASTLGYSTQDYVLRSADALFVPLGALLVLALGAVFAHRFAMHRLKHPRTRPAARAAVLAGTLLFALGVVAIFTPGSFSPPYLLATASPAIGITLIAFGRHVLALTGRGPATPPGATTALVVLVIVLGTFATVARYADALGHDRAADLHLDALPRVTVFTPKNLVIEADGVVDEPLLEDDGAYRHRYSGLRLLVRSDGKYFLLPEGWTRSDGAAIVIADDPSYRFEFAPGTGTRTGAEKPPAGSKAAASVLPQPVMGPAPTIFEAKVGKRTKRRFPVGGDAAPATVKGFSILGDDKADFRVARGTCRVGARLAPRMRCHLEVTFAPRAKGDRSAVLVVDVEPGEDERAELSGLGR